MPLLENKQDRLEYLGRLVKAGEEACRIAYKHRTQIGGAVNWGDLHCVSAEYRMDEQGREFFAILVEEAAPGCEADSVAGYISKRLDEMGFIDIRVETEW